MLSRLESLCFLHSFSNEELNMQACVCVCSSSICARDRSSRDPLFTLFPLSPSSYTLISWCPSFSFSFFPSSAECFKMQKYQRVSLNPRHSRTKSQTLECLYSWRKCFGPLLYCHSVCLFVVCPLHLIESIPIHVKAFVPAIASCLRFIRVSTSPGWRLPSWHAPSFLLFPFALCTRSFVLFLQSHYVCNRIAAEPFRAVWLSY